jgi:hypothetical protein
MLLRVRVEVNGVFVWFVEITISVNMSKTLKSWIFVI